jgi:hypothetical protein
LFLELECDSAQDLKGVVVSRNGCIVAERYFSGDGPDANRDTHEMVGAESLLEKRSGTFVIFGGLICLTVGHSMRDAFISHASEDKDQVARPLAVALQSAGLDIWYDEFSLSLGDSLRASIDSGLSDSRYGIVVLSPSFFAKRWPQEELNGLFAKELLGTKTILPIWHNIKLSGSGSLSLARASAC